jgi:hypothetical protein
VLDNWTHNLPAAKSVVSGAVMDVMRDRIDKLTRQRMSEYSAICSCWVL